ncbi:MAG: hypothetical protein MHPSP_002826, partial [Paramarteilia canceri]
MNRCNDEALQDVMDELALLTLAQLKEKAKKLQLPRPLPKKKADFISKLAAHIQDCHKEN